MSRMPSRTRSNPRCIFVACVSSPPSRAPATSTRTCGQGPPRDDAVGRVRRPRARRRIWRRPSVGRVLVANVQLRVWRRHGESDGERRRWKRIKEHEPDADDRGGCGGSHIFFLNLKNTICGAWLCSAPQKSGYFCGARWGCATEENLVARLLWRTHHAPTVRHRKLKWCATEDLFPTSVLMIT